MSTAVVVITSKQAAYRFMQTALRRLQKGLEIMKVLNFGSLFLNHEYGLEHIMRKGEILAANSYQCSVGGKGVNQSVALANAGAEVYHAGLIGKDGLEVRNFLERHHVNTQYIKIVDLPTGNNTLQTTPNGNNCAVSYSGANRCISKEFIDTVLSSFSSGDYLIVQNEVNLVKDIIKRAKALGMHVIWNPSPFTSDIQNLKSKAIDWMILNETEGALLSGEPDPKRMPGSLLKHYPYTKIVLMLGNKDVIYIDKDQFIRQKAWDAGLADDIIAEDAFVGFFFASIINGLDISTTMHYAAKAYAITIMRTGSEDPIPKLEEVVA